MGEGVGERRAAGGRAARRAGAGAEEPAPAAGRAEPPGRPSREPEPPADEPAAAPPPEAGPAAGDGHEGARVIALNMALSGSPRDETARYLSENFELDDPEALLDEVYARVSG